MLVLLHLGHLQQSPEKRGAFYKERTKGACQRGEGGTISYYQRDGSSFGTSLSLRKALEKNKGKAARGGACQMNQKNKKAEGSRGGGRALQKKRSKVTYDQV